MTRGNRASHPATKHMSPEVGKWVTVNVNGNAHHEARILISPYTVRQFENLLSHLTDKLKPPFGAVWRLFTETGTEIKDLEEIKGGNTYIASGRAKPPTFPVRARSSRGPRDGDSSQGRERRELRSHSAVGSLGGSTSTAAAGRAPGAALDTNSDTNVQQKPCGHACSPGVSGGAARPARHYRPAPAPRRAKQTKEQTWDQTWTNQQQYHDQQHLPSQRKQYNYGAKHSEDFGQHEDLGRVEGLPMKQTTRNTH